MAKLSDENYAHLKKQAALLQSHLYILEEQIAAFGNLHVPTYKLIERDTILQQIRDIEHQLSPSAFPHERSPYIGLSSFTERDSDLFFGRDELIFSLTRDIEHTAFLVVIGPSGSGKSSLVSAGLIPSLKSGSLPGSENWLYLPLLELGDQPVESIATSLATFQGGTLGDVRAIQQELVLSDRALFVAAKMLTERASAKRLVLVINQAEDLWSKVPVETSHREQYINDQQLPVIRNLLSIVDSARSGDCPILVILTMRADFLSQAIQDPKFAAAIQQNLEFVTAMTPDQLRQAIERPAALYGRHFQHGLVDALVEQVKGQPGALPLLQYTLSDLWEHATIDGNLTWDRLKQLGGVQGALAKHANDVYQELSLSQKQVMRRVMLSLIQIGDDDQVTRRKLLLTELLSDDSEATDVEKIVQRLADERLLTTNILITDNDNLSPGTIHADTVKKGEVQSKSLTLNPPLVVIELAHEALIWGWPQYRQWMDESLDNLRLQRQLREASAQWEKEGQSPSYLFKGAQLEVAEQRIRDYGEHLSGREQRFLSASIAERKRELLQRFIARIIGIIAITGIIALLIFVALQSKQVEQQTHARLIFEQGRSTFSNRPLLGLRLMIEGLTQVSNSDQETRQVMFNNLKETVHSGYILNIGSDISKFFTAPNDSIVIVKHDNVEGEVYRISDGVRIAVLSGRVHQIYFSPDSESTYFVIAYNDKPGELRLTKDGSLIATFKDKLSLSENSVIFSRDSKSKYLLLNYDKGDGEIRSATDNNFVKSMNGRPYGAFFSHDPAVSFFVVVYTDSRRELWRTNDFQYVKLKNAPEIANGSATQSSIVGGRSITDNPLAAFSLDEKSSYVVIQNNEDEYQLIQTSDGNDISGIAVLGSPLSASFLQANLVVFNTATNDNKVEVVHGYFSSFSDAKYFIVRQSDSSDHLRRTSDNMIIDDLSGDVEDVWFSPDGNANYVIVNYKNGKAELRKSKDNKYIVNLSGKVKDVYFSDDADTRYVVLGYDNNHGELWSTIKGAIINKINVYPGQVSFSTDANASHFIIDQRTFFTPLQLYTSDSGVLIKEFGGPIALGNPVIYSPDNNASYLFGVYMTDGDEFRRTSDGSVVAKFPNDVDSKNNAIQLIFPQKIDNVDSSGVFVANYQNGHSELWDLINTPQSISDLGLSVDTVVIDSHSRQLLMRYTDDHAYLVDISWLRTIGANASSIPINDFIDIVCKGPLARTSLWTKADQDSFNEIMSNKTSYACN